jgi:hypothetical protein
VTSNHPSSLIDALRRLRFRIAERTLQKQGVELIFGWKKSATQDLEFSSLELGAISAGLIAKSRFGRASAERGTSLVERFESASTASRSRSERDKVVLGQEIAGQWPFAILACPSLISIQLVASGRGK